VTAQPVPVQTAVDDRQQPTGATLEQNPRRWWIFATVSIALFMASIDQTIVATALPTLQKDLHAQVNWGAWTITAYALGQVIAMPLAGKVSDLYGRKPVFMTSVAVFTAASLGCAMVDNIYLLVALRAVQSLGGGAFMPSATGIVSDAFGPDRDRAIGMFASIFPIGAVFGPVLGGVLVTYWSWRGIFLVNVPIGVVLLVVGTVILPASVRRPAAGIDVLGVGLLATLLLGAMLGLANIGGGTSASAPGFWLPELIAVLALVWFVRHAATAVNAFIPIRLLRERAFAVMNLFNFLFGCSALGFGALVPLYAEQRYGIKTLQAGTLLTARAVGMMLVAAAAVMALRRTGYRMPMIVGSSVVVVGLVALAVVPIGPSAYLELSAAAAMTGIGMGFSIPATNNAVLNLAPQDTAGISGLRGMFRQAGAITGVSVSTAVLARSADPGLAQAWSFVVFAGIVALTIPLVMLVPDHHGRW
jgi:EmrB/QacA subfamily drug resistance transporter